MKNKIKLKRYLLVLLLLSLTFFLLLLGLHIYEYQAYTKNYNEKIEQIFATVKEKYPMISDQELISILNGEGKEVSFFQKYGIDLEKESILLQNDNTYQRFLFLDSFLLLSLVFVFLFLFLKYNSGKEKEIQEITYYIEELNKKNYSLSLESISEDELSILKNEIYKITVMLRESAENSLKDKKELKESLEDISHQLKTPLTSILIMLDTLMDDPTMDRTIQEEFIRDIKREVANVNFFIQAILKLSKFDANTIDFVKEKISLSNLLQRALKNVSTLCDLKNMKVEIIGSEDIFLFCDSHWQVEALTNILKNAIDHSKENSKIEISYSQNRVYTLLTIKDYGKGISKKDLPHIFERFYKGENANPDSVGIGLALSKSIIEKDNGKIDVTSSKEGTMFEIKYYQ